ncbi:MAG: hypothetical protein CMP63_07115 [Flavobacteriales bacterium]|nr:hypothetical protein [Flavobacteriales bacterium]|tara:strand:- start:2954 stop:3427 length:474 start_codon:yes stop_codon:yes gene_type:complete
MKKIMLSIYILTLVSCTWDEIDVPPTPTYYEIWSGPTISFTKESGADPTDSSNQDQITPSVSITRGNDGGQIYNAVSETQAEKSSSPIGTEWAIGDTSDIENLIFAPFRSAVGSPKRVVGKKLVLHIIEEDVYMSVEFTSWVSAKSGGFAYIRSSEN